MREDLLPFSNDAWFLGFIYRGHGFYRYVVTEHRHGASSLSGKECRRCHSGSTGIPGKADDAQTVRIDWRIARASVAGRRSHLSLVAP